MAFNIIRSDMIAQNKRSNASLANNKYFGANLLTDMINNGFEVVESDTMDMFQATKVLLKPSTEVDPIWDTDPWYVGFWIWGSGEKIGEVPYNFSGIAISVIPSIPSLVPSINSFSNTSMNWFPLIPAKVSGGTPNSSSSGDAEEPRMHSSKPYSYCLTIVNRGFAINAWNQIQTESITTQGTFVVQRGVGCGGSVNIEGQRPLYLVTNICPKNGVINTSTSSNGSIPAGPTKLWFYQVVREKDTIIPKPNFERIAYTLNDGFGELALLRTSISDSMERQGNIMNRFPNTWKAPVTSDNGEYIMIFPYGLSTNRFSYSDEIDLIAVSKADAYQANQIVPLTVYGEEREYTAMCSNNVELGYAHGIRVFILTNGPEFY